MNATYGYTDDDLRLILPRYNRSFEEFVNSTPHFAMIAATTGFWLKEEVEAFIYELSHLD